MDRPRRYRRRAKVVTDERGDVFSAGAPMPRPTPEMLADAWRRACAPRSITAFVMGDPAPGQSALDQRGSNGP